MHVEMSSHINFYLNFPFLYLVEKQSDEHFWLEPQRGTRVGARMCVSVSLSVDARVCLGVRVSVTGCRELVMCLLLDHDSQTDKI